MSRPAALLPTWLHGELAARPGRWRRAVAMSGGATLALAIALGLQVASFPAPLIAFRALQPSVVLTWRNMFVWLAIIAVATVAIINLVGVLVDVPWLLVPIFVLAIAAAAYTAPIQESPVVGYCIALLIAAVTYTAVFAPDDVGTSTLTLVCGFAIGLVVATTIAQVAGADRPDERLSRSLAAVFARVRDELRATGARYRENTSSSVVSRQSSVEVGPTDDRRPTTDNRRPTSDDDRHPGARTPDAVPQLAQHVQLLNQVRQEARRPGLERAFVALITAAERIEMYAALAGGLAQQATGGSYRHLLDHELAALLEASDHALDRFTQAARDPACVLSSDATPASRSGPWPDFDALVTALRARQRALSQAGQLADISIEESTNVNGFTQALAGIAEVLHLPPEALEHVAPEAPPPARRVAPVDPYAAQYALKIGVGCAVALLIGIVSHTRQLETIVLNPVLLAQGSYGASIRRADLRLIAVAFGGILTSLVVVGLMPNTTEVAVWLLVFFAILLPSAYVAVGTPRFGYFGLQVATTFIIVLVADKPVVDIHHALWRFYGTLIGSALMLATFEVFLPDYAGRQVISRFGDMLRTLLSIVPRLDRPLPPLEVTAPRGDHIITSLAEVLRLADEMWYEGADSGVDRHAAVDSAGVLRRIVHRWALVRRARRTARPALPAALHDSIARLEDELVEYVRLLLAFVEARHNRGRPGSRSYRAAFAAAAAVDDRPRPDLAAALRDLDAATAAARRDELRVWPIDAATAVLAEVGHLRRLVELLPALDASLRQMGLPVTTAASTTSRWRILTPRPAQ